MANVYTREGKKGIQIYFDYKTPENPRKRVPSGIYLSGSKMHQKKQLAEALLMAQELEEEAKKKGAYEVDAIKQHKARPS